MVVILLVGIAAGCTSESSPAGSTVATTLTSGQPSDVPPSRAPSPIQTPADVLKAAFQLPTGAHPQDVVAADLDGDGRLDLVSTNETSSDVSVLIQAPDGSFEGERRYAAGPGNAYLEAADLDGDGNVDIVTTNGGHATGSGEIEPGNDTISVLFGIGDGRLQPRVDFPAGEIPVGLAIADLNGDTIPDVVTANRHAGTITVLLGDRGWRAPTIATVTITGLRLTRWVTVADVNGDGAADLVVPDEPGGLVWIATGSGDGTFGEARGHPTEGSQPVAVSAGDLNGDGALDLMVANGYPAKDISVLVNQGNGSFAPPVKYGVGTYPHSIFPADIDGDGALDLVSGNDFDGTVSVLLGHGDASFQEAITIRSGSAGGLAMISVADLDGDGRLDVITANWDPNELSILLGSAP